MVVTLAVLPTNQPPKLSESLAKPALVVASLLYFALVEEKMISHQVESGSARPINESVLRYDNIQATKDH